MNKIELLRNRISFSAKRGSAKEDPTKAVTPMIYFGRFEAEDGVVVTLGLGWWHWYVRIQVGYVYEV